jgi:hypothetical protein
MSKFSTKYLTTGAADVCAHAAAQGSRKIYGINFTTEIYDETERFMERLS